MPVTYVVGVLNCSMETFDMTSAGKVSGRETKYEKNQEMDISLWAETACVVFRQIVHQALHSMDTGDKIGNSVFIRLQRENKNIGSATAKSLLRSELASWFKV